MAALRKLSSRGAEAGDALALGVLVCRGVCLLLPREGFCVGGEEVKEVETVMARALTLESMWTLTVI